MFGLRFRSSSRRVPKAQEFDEADKKRIEYAKNAQMTYPCPIHLNEYMEVAKCFADTAGLFCFEKAFAFISDFKELNFGWQNTPFNSYVLVFDILEQIANCDRKYYILSYLEDTEVAHQKPLKLSYMSLYKRARILQDGYRKMKNWKLTRLLEEIKTYVRCRICAINLYAHMSKTEKNSEIDWKQIVERVESMIKMLLSDCKQPREPGKNINQWDTDSDIEDLKETLSFLPVEEVMRDSRLETVRDRIEMLSRRSKANIQRIAENNRLYFREHHLEQAESIKEQRERELRISEMRERVDEEQRKTAKEVRRKLQELKQPILKKESKKFDAPKEYAWDSTDKRKRKVYLYTPDEMEDMRWSIGKCSPEASINAMGSARSDSSCEKIERNVPELPDQKVRWIGEHMWMPGSSESDQDSDSEVSGLSTAPSRKTVSDVSTSSGISVFNDEAVSTSPTPVPTPAPSCSSKSANKKEYLCPLVDIFTGDDPETAEMVYVSRMFDQIDEKDNTPCRRKRIMRQVEKKLAKLQTCTYNELMLAEAEHLDSETDSEDDEEKREERRKICAKLEGRVAQSSGIQNGIRIMEEEVGSNSFCTTIVNGFKNRNDEVFLGKRRRTQSLNARYKNNSVSTLDAKHRKRRHSTQNRFLNEKSKKTIRKRVVFESEDETEEEEEKFIEKLRQQRLQRILKILRKKAAHKMREEANLKSEVQWFRSTVKKQLCAIRTENGEDAEEREDQEPYNWYKRVEENMELVKEVKNMRADSAENCAERYAHFEKMVGYEVPTEDGKEDDALEHFYSREEIKRDIAQQIKEKILEKRWKFHMDIHQPDWERLQKLLKKKAKAERALRAKYQREGAFYALSSDDEDDEPKKKSHIFQSLRRMFIHELYTLMLLLEAQHQMTSVNIVRCVGFMNQLSNQFDFLAKELEAVDPPQDAPSFYSMNNFKIRKMPIKPRNNLIHWLMHVYQLLLAKFSLYSADILGPSCLNPEEFSVFQTLDNGFNFIEKCVEYCQKSHPYFLCICVGGRKRISEKDGNFEACMLLPEEGVDRDDVEVELARMKEHEKYRRQMYNYKLQFKQNKFLLKRIMKKNKIEHLDQLPLEEALEQIMNLDLTRDEQDFMLNNAKFGFLTMRDVPEGEIDPHREERERIQRMRKEMAEQGADGYDPSLYVPILFRLPSALNPDHDAEGLVDPENQAPAFKATSDFVRNHLHHQALEYQATMPSGKKPFRLYDYDKKGDKSFFGEAIERNIYMVVIFKGKVQKWEKRAFKFFETILPDMRCSNSLRLLSTAARNPDLGMLGREYVDMGDSDSEAQ